MIDSRTLALYLGCQMQYATHHEPQYETYTLNPDNLKDAIEFGDKPVLRPLSSITEEECKIFHELQGGGGNYKLLISKYYPQTFQYLLSKGFDLFNLIETNQAIEAKP